MLKISSPLPVIVKLTIIKQYMNSILTLLISKNVGTQNCPSHESTKVWWTVLALPRALQNGMHWESWNSSCTSIGHFLSRPDLPYYSQFFAIIYQFQWNLCHNQWRYQTASVAWQNDLAWPKMHPFTTLTQLQNIQRSWKDRQKLH